MNGDCLRGGDRCLEDGPVRPICARASGPSWRQFGLYCDGMSRADDQLRALATGAYGVESRVEQVGLFAYGLKTNRRGRRRAGLALLGLVLVVLAAVVVAVALS